MHPVGHVFDRYFVHRDSGPQTLPHMAADLAVQFADGVAARREMQRERSHAELFPAVGWIAPPETQKLLPGDSE